MSNKYALRPMHPSVMRAMNKVQGPEKDKFEFDIHKYQIGDVLDVWWGLGHHTRNRKDGRYLVLDKGYFLWPFNAFMVIMKLDTLFKIKVFHTEEAFADIEIVGGAD